MAQPTFVDFPIKDKIVIVTGGGAGIGLSFVKLAIDQGAKVLIADLKLHKDAEKCGITATSAGIHYQKCDVTKWEQLQAVVDTSQKVFGDVPDVYVASAGVFEGSGSDFWGDVEADKYSILDINVNHPVKLTRLAIRACLGKQKKGVVCIVASIAGYGAGQYPAPLYSTSKFAVIGFTRAMTDTGTNQGVKVVAMCPGIVSTPLWADRPEVKDRFSIIPEISITPEAVAGEMVKLVEDGQYGSGTVFETSILGSRTVPTWNIDPPGGAKMAEGTGIPEAFIQKANAPVLAISKKETGALL